MRVPFLDLQAAHRELWPEIEAAMLRVAESGWYVGGREVKAFEEVFASYCGAAHATGVANGLDALTLILRGYEIGPGDEVIVPAHTFIATWLAVSAAGARVAPVDVDARTSNLDPEGVESAITPRTKAIIAVHLYGQPAEMNALADIAGRHRLRLIEDAAQAHGARYHGRRAGTLGDAAAFSFYPAKNLGAMGDGGMVVTDDGQLAARVRVLANYGSREKYFHLERGVNSRLDPVQAAILAVKLDRLEQWNARRRRLAARYQAALRGIDDLILPPAPGASEPVWHIYAVRTTARDEVAVSLRESGVETLVHYPVPPHLSGAYEDHGWMPGDFPVAEEIARTELSLPMGPHLSDGEQDRVIGALREALASRPAALEHMEVSA